MSVQSLIKSSKAQKITQIILLIISITGAAYAISVVIPWGPTEIIPPQFVVFAIIWSLESALLWINRKIGIVAFLGAFVIFWLFVTNGPLRDFIGVIKDPMYD